ncbi:MAG TPA: iron uptake transporter deferrochelatase/peroxidase subunit [Jatrophihabitantaceae bacterium]|jgi:deferrochelatase/peroxidase EfeB|nr:iron uptake transporter deferrochelatase/peroxidase subunit [Jatrophihabitantaceae bacterium]
MPSARPGSSEPGRGLPSRRRFLGTALGAAGAVAAGGSGLAVAQTTGGMPKPLPDAVSFYGTHQAGIATPAAERMAFAAFDVTTAERAALENLLSTWAAAAARFTAGRPLSDAEAVPHTPPADTGEAVGLPPSRLTITVGFGPSLFDQRFGLAPRRPAALAEIPALPGDVLEPARSGGDLCVQACADDAQVAFHVIRNFARLGRGTAVMRWSQLGFGRSSSTSTHQSTPRNLMGFKDGTDNITGESSADLAQFVWVGTESDQDWMRAGSYLVARRIRMHIESWDTELRSDQESVFGRRKSTGAPLSGTAEFDPPDLTARNAHGRLIIPADAHIRLASPSANAGQRILRRGYSYTDGIDADTGLLDAGLFFIAFQKDPRTQFVPIQRRLAENDALNEYVRHTGSALFAVPPGVSGPGDWFGKGLFS